MGQKGGDWMDEEMKNWVINGQKEERKKEWVVFSSPQSLFVKN